MKAMSASGRFCGSVRVIAPAVAEKVRLRSTNVISRCVVRAPGSRAGGRAVPSGKAGVAASASGVAGLAGCVVGGVSASDARD